MSINERERAVLSRLAASSQAMTRAQLAPRKTTKAFLQAGLTDQAAVEACIAQLIVRDWVIETKKARSVTYRITDAGAEQLAASYPSASTRQEAFLLLQGLGRGTSSLTEGEANKAITKEVKDALDLTAESAGRMRRQLNQSGCLGLEKVNRSVHITLTPAGKERLLSLEHHDAVKFPVTGKALNELVQLARGSKSLQSPTHDSSRHPVARGEMTAGYEPAPADLGSAVYAILQELTRERHSRDRMVPIFEIRREITRKYGPDTARHDVLDQVMFDLWTAKRVRLISAADLRMHSEQELAESINKTHNTFFYMEETDGRH